MSALPRRVLAALALVAASPALAAQVDDYTAMAIAAPQEVIVDRSLAPGKVSAMLRPVLAFYGFWNNGSTALLNAALSPDFIDHTLPPGRPQGPAGPAMAGAALLGAVPDVRVTVVQRLVVGDRVVTHMRFAGHFTGSFMGTRGNGQAVSFIATDILRVRGGKVTDNWHLEDNQAFMQQIGLAPKP